MSGFTNEVFIQLRDDMTQSHVIKSFIEGLQLYFRNEISPKIEEENLYFFQKNTGTEKLYSFVLNFEEESGNLSYFSFTDNSSDTSSLFADNSFFDTMSNGLKKIGKKIIWLNDPEYDSIREVFELSVEDTLALIDLEKPF